MAIIILTVVLLVAAYSGTSGPPHRLFGSLGLGGGLWSAGFMWLITRQK
jgi:hypothetical protein